LAGFTYFALFRKLCFGVTLAYGFILCGKGEKISKGKGTEEKERGERRKEDLLQWLKGRR